MSVIGKNVLRPEQFDHVSPAVEAVDLRDAEVERLVEMTEVAVANIPDSQIEQPVERPVDYKDYPEVKAEATPEPVEAEATPAPLIPIGAFQTKHPVQIADEDEELPISFDKYTGEESEPEPTPVAPVVPIKKYQEAPPLPPQPAAQAVAPELATAMPVESYQQTPVLQPEPVVVEIEPPTPEIPEEYILAARARTEIAQIHSVQAPIDQRHEYAEKEMAA